MNRIAFIFLFAFLISACNEATSIKEHHNDAIVADRTSTDTLQVSVVDDKIVPGKSVGKIAIGQLPETITSILGKPDSSDAAMGKAWMTWIGKRDVHNNKTELNVYVTYKDSTMKEKVVKQIRTTSSSFSTPNGIHVYSSLEEIQKNFPGAKDVATYASATRRFTIYDDVDSGIAFDIVDANEQRICTGITVHSKGEPVIETYIYLHPDMKKVLPLRTN